MTTYDQLLDGCAQEPIRMLGAIQAVGAFMALELDGTITHVSANTTEWFGREAEELLGAHWCEVLTQPTCDELVRGLQERGDHFMLFWARPTDGHAVVMKLWNRDDGVPGYLLELELEHSPHHVWPDYSLMGRSVDELLKLLHQNEHGEMGEMLDAVVDFIQRVTGFDRVMCYRFDGKWNGDVVSESVSERSRVRFKGMRFPATDIPPQARALYAEKLSRSIHDVNTPPVAIVPPCDAGSAHPIELGRLNLRSVSPVHVQYLKNMGVGASMSLSIMVDDKLWGLIACHHDSPYHTGAALRSLCENFTRIVSLHIFHTLTRESATQSATLDTARQQLHRTLLKGQPSEQALTDYIQAHLDERLAHGALIFVGEEPMRMGMVPPDVWVNALRSWLIAQQGAQKDLVIQRENLTIEELGLAQEKSFLEDVHMPGLLFLPLSQDRHTGIALLRQEHVREVRWGGDPLAKARSVDEKGREYLTPRGSFEEWREVERGRSKPWTPQDIQLLLELRATLLDALIQRSNTLTRLNKALDTHNSSLESFAFIVSHDLKAPLRAMSGYSQFLSRDYHNLLDDQGRFMLDSLVRLSHRTAELLDDLLQFSTSATRELPLHGVDISPMLSELRRIHLEANPELDLVITLPESPSPILGNETALRQIFDNLISNAIKHNDEARAHISVSEAPPAPERAVTLEQSLFATSYVHLVVEDNGPGIPEQYHQTVFRIFQRPTASARVPGTGVGLALVDKLVRRLGGDIWLDQAASGKGLSVHLLLPRFEEAPSHG